MFVDILMPLDSRVVSMLYTYLTSAGPFCRVCTPKKGQGRNHDHNRKITT